MPTQRPDFPDKFHYSPSLSVEPELVKSGRIRVQSCLMRTGANTSSPARVIFQRPSAAAYFGVTIGPGAGHVRELDLECEFPDGLELRTEDPSGLGQDSEVELTIIHY